MSIDQYQKAFGWLGTITTVVSFIFPIFPYLNVIRKKLYFENTPIVQVTTCYINYLCWCIYGHMIYTSHIQYCFLIGSIINFVLIFIYIAFELKKYLIDSILNLLILFTGTWALYRVLEIIIDKEDVVGKIAVGTSFIVFLTPIRAIYKVIKNKNYNIIPIYNCYFIFLYSIFWFIFGIFIPDYNIIVPYFVSFVLSLIEIVIFWNYKINYPSISEREFDSTIGIESSTEESTKKEMPIKFEEENDDYTGKNKPVKISAEN